MLANLRALFSVVVDIILLRRGPEQLPASTVLLYATVGIYLVISAMVVASVSTPDGNWPLELIIGAASMLVWYQVALQLAKKRERYPQTMTAMFGVSTIFAPLLVPMLIPWPRRSRRNSSRRSSSPCWRCSCWSG